MGKPQKREHKDIEAVNAGAAGVRDDKGARGGAEKPASWRSYIEQAEAAEKKAERDAARLRAAQHKAAKRRFQPKALAGKAKAALGAVKNPAGRDQVKEKAAQAGAALADKKRAGDSITIVIPKRIGRCALKTMPVTELLPVIQAGWGA